MAQEKPSPKTIASDASKSQLPSSLMKPDEGAKRAPSIQFDRSPDGRRPSADNKRAGRPKSPPPAPKFENRVSFDTFEKKGEPVYTSFSLNSKHVDYKAAKGTRTFLCGIDDNDYSYYALEWLIDEMVDDGDEIVCLRVVDKDSTVANSASLEDRNYRKEADALMSSIQDKNHENKAINLILEFAVGKVEKVIMATIRLYEPAFLVVGTRGRNRSGIQGLLPGSVSKFCLQNSPVPVIVVRPNTQRARGKRKRMHDPARQYYRDLLDKAAPDHSVESLVGLESPTMPAVEDEAAAVAKALGILEQQQHRPKSPGAAPRGMSPGLDRARRSPLVQVTSAEEVATVKSLQAASGAKEVPKPIEPTNIAVDEADAKGVLSETGDVVKAEQTGGDPKEQAGPQSG